MLERTAGKVGPAIAAQLRALIEPKSLAIMVGGLIAWVVSHGFAVGEIIDFIVAVVGVFSIGLAVFSGIDELYEFGRDTHYAKTPPDLDGAADHLAKAIAILGIQAVLAVLFKGRPATRRAKARSVALPRVENSTSPHQLVSVFRDRRHAMRRLMKRKRGNRGRGVSERHSQH